MGQAQDSERARHQQEHPEAHQLEVFDLDEQLGQHEQLLVAEYSTMSKTIALSHVPLVLLNLLMEVVAER